MQVLLNIRFSFLCRTTRTNQGGKSPIVLRIAFRSERRDVFTGLYCFEDHWDAQNNRVKKADKASAGLNQNLDLILRKAGDAFDELKYSGDGFTIDELVDKVKGKEASPTLLIDYLEEADRKMLKRVGVEW
jgi:hypothetical protein